MTSCCDAVALDFATAEQRVLLAGFHQFGILLVMQASRLPRSPAPIARTIRFPERLRARLAADAQRCGRSFEGQVLAILRSHYGEDVDIAPTPEAILGLARGSFAGVAGADRKRVARRLEQNERA